jgi:signal transduction histidine kinase
MVRYLRDRVWQIHGAAEGLELFGMLTEALLDAGVPVQDCRLYALEPEADEQALRLHPLRPATAWRTVGPEESSAILSVWRGETGAGVPQASHGSGWEEGAVLRIPFPHGLLELEVPPDTELSAHAARSVEEAVGVLSALFCRLEDLQRLETLEWQLCQVQGLAAVGRLAAEAAHEINNPLCALLGECALLLEEELDPGVREGVEALYRAGMQARTISSRLLSFARPQAARPEQLDLNQLVREVLHLVRRQFDRKSIELVEELEEDLPVMAGYAGLLQQVVLNLVQNSREAILSVRDGGRIWVRTYLLGGAVMLEVEDDGPGVPESIKERVFEPFFTTKGGTQGIGLGLGVCQRIARTHGGQLRLEPRSWGACMVLELPCLEQARLAGAVATGPLVAVSSA